MRHFPLCGAALEDFYWQDTLPSEVRLTTVHTGTWSEDLTYSVTYRTNLSKEFKNLKTNLSSKTNHTLDCTKLTLAENEFVTQIRFEFGTVQPQFTCNVTPRIEVRALETLKDDIRIVNHTEVGGRIGDHRVTAEDRWVTVAFIRVVMQIANHPQFSQCSGQS